MKILFTSDIHASIAHLFSMLSIAEKEKVDTIIIGGDVIPHSLPDPAGMGALQTHAKYIEDVLIPGIKDFKKRSHADIYMDLGNDDFVCNRKILEKYDGSVINLVHMKKSRLTDHVDIIGYMVVPPTPFRLKDWEKPDTTETPFTQGNRVTMQGYVTVNGRLEPTVLNLASDDTIEKDLEALSRNIDNPFIFVSHSPPYDTPLDVIYSGLHVGSLSIRRFIETWSEKGLLIASLHGHIHESPTRSGSIQTKIGDAVCINPGQGNGQGAAFRYVMLRLSGDSVEVTNHH
ncbi:MAG: metallophosphoesterase [Deltaproteobacteria bacterium]|nr:metallophosphoesterase [Deltaproteobacteria bacterium]